MQHTMGSRTGAAVVRRLAVAAVAVATLTFPQDAGAAMANDPFSGMAPLPDTDLRHLRGGLRIGGMDFNIGMMIRAEVQEAMEGMSQRLWVETRLTFDDNGQLQSASPTTSSGGEAAVTTPTPGRTQVRLSGNQSRILQDIADSGITTQIQSQGAGGRSALTVDLDVALKNHSQLFGDVSRAMTSMRALQNRLGLSGLN